ncbi:FCD domain-containing protein [Corynebacterium poyangense]|uniref:FCD domain-containing protein n=1 Tax=Corynebacterium poyangense TaxID=2684405 RepID=A0A7H0SS47_9CORY|nr:GntR family transcriptional regulator [Corynebacterium poyangense]MBZ8176832.1 FCD domain-containing protein [Corynebacterium poyangense]QNQ91372.1 FCD domain-containing protein [Corynebacterium poyangense]
MISPEDPRFSGMNKSERAYHLLKERITRNEYAPGHRLVLSTLADTLGSSVVPVREAIRRLEAEGLVDYVPNVGPRVAMVNDHMYVDCMQLTAILEGAATALAAPYMQEPELAKARELNEKMQMSLGAFDPREFTTLNRKFHQTLFKRCPNQDLVELIEVQWERLNYLRESTFAFVPDRAETSVAEHEKLLAMISAGADPEYIEKLARQHRLHTLEKYLQARNQ